MADGSTYPRRSPIESFALERLGDPPPEGIGAVRVFRQGRTTGRDQIIELVPNQRIAYTSESDLPIHDYVAEVDLEAAPSGGTTIHWHASFRPKMIGTGWLIKFGIRRFLKRTAHGLAAYAAAHPHH